jgi:hypothetical protein
VALLSVAAASVTAVNVVAKGDDGWGSNKGESREDIIYFLLF